MNRKQAILDDLRLASLAKKVIYLEGKTDVDIFFALLGMDTPSDGLHRGVLVKGLSEKEGSGSTEIKSRLNIVLKERIKGVFGPIDGDGGDYDSLSQEFDLPHAGPLFRWKSYCIENLLAKTGWPSIWGSPLEWVDELRKYGPYVVVNRLQSEIQAKLRTLGLARTISPSPNEPLKDSAEILAGLESAKHLLVGYDVAYRFREDLEFFEKTLVGETLDHAHCVLNGKWIIEHLAPTRAERPKEECRADWLAHAISVGGLPEVRDWWERVIGSPP